MIEIKTQKLTDELKEKVDQGFKRHALETIGHDEKYPPKTFVAFDDNQFAGIVVCQLFWGALHIKYLIVDEDFRNKKIGTKLMQHAFNYALKHQCSFACIETMNFQALNFYLKLGFEIEFTRHGYLHDTSFHYLKKELSAPF